MRHASGTSLLFTLAFAACGTGVTSDASTRDGGSDGADRTTACTDATTDCAARTDTGPMDTVTATDVPTDVQTPVDVPPLVCATNRADCNGVASDDCEVDLQSDGSHCGRCGHSCLGGACAAGACQPVTLATGIYIGASLVVDSSGIYFVNLQPLVTTPPAHNPANITRIPLAGGPMEVLASNQTQANSIALDDTYIYWTNGGTTTSGSTNNDGQVMRVLKTGGTPEVMAANEGYASGLVRNDTALFWMDFRPAGGRIRTMPLAGGSPTSLFTGIALGNALSVGPAHIAFGSGAGAALNVGPIAGGTSRTLASGQPDIWGTVIVGDQVFWANKGSTVLGRTGPGSINRVPAAGGMSTVLVPMLFNSLDPSVVGDYLYWVNQGTVDSTMNPARSRNDGSVMRVAISTGTVQTIASSVQGPTEVFATADAVYWYERVANGEGRIVRLAF